MGAVVIELEDVDRLNVAVSISEYLSVVALLWEASGKARGVPEPLRRAIAAELPSRGQAAMRPMSDPARSMVPDCVLPIDPTIDNDLAGSVDRLRTISASAIEADIAHEFGDTPPAAWQGPANAPRPWLDAYTSSVAATAAVADPLLSRARPLMDREIARIGSLLVRGGPVAVLQNLTPRISATDSQLRFEDVEPGAASLAGRRIALLPMVAGHRMLITHLENPEVVWIGYPVPDVGQLWSAQPAAAPSDSLAHLIGRPRAAILQALRRPALMSQVAALVGCSASTVTFHISRLEQAGLVLRTRLGQEVQVSITERGRQLFDVMQ